MTQDDIIKYFTAEKNESLVFVSIGTLAFTLALYAMFILRTDFYKGLFYPLLIIAIIQIFVGGSVYFRAPKDIERVTQMIGNFSEKLRTEELPRMVIVNKNFIIYRYLEISLALVGIIILLFSRHNSFMMGFGVGLTLQSLLMLGADYFAEQRALVYTEILEKFISTHLPV